MAIVALVEDDPEDVAKFTTLLQSLNHKVYCYSTAESAREALSSRNFDALLLDLKLGSDEMAGHKLLMSTPEVDRPPRILVISSLPDVHIWRPLMLGEGAWDYLEKKIENGTFQIKLQRLLDYTSVATNTHVQVGSIAWPTDRICQMTWRGQKLGIPLQPAMLVTKLVRASPNVVSQRVLLKELDAPTLDNLFAQMSNARACFRVWDRDFSAIVTVQGIGYKRQE